MASALLLMMDGVVANCMYVANARKAEQERGREWKRQRQDTSSRAGDRLHIIISTSLTSHLVPSLDTDTNNDPFGRHTAHGLEALTAGAPQVRQISACSSKSVVCAVNTFRLLLLSVITSAHSTSATADCIGRARPWSARSRQRLNRLITPSHATPELAGMVGKARRGLAVGKAVSWDMQGIMHGRARCMTALDISCHGPGNTSPISQQSGAWRWRHSYATICRLLCHLLAPSHAAPLSSSLLLPFMQCAHGLCSPDVRPNVRCEWW
jgi:hypothetical protein